MRHLLALLFLLACTSATKTEAQPSLCLSPGESANNIDYEPGALNRYLHLDHYKIVFFGEQHNDQFDPAFKYHLITELNKLSGIRHVFMEMSVSRAWRCNRYLQTGDTGLISISSQGPRYAAFWRRLYEYNASLPESQKLVVHGVDFETTGVFTTLRLLSPAGAPVPPALRAVMDTVAGHLADPPLHMWSMIDGKFILYDNSPFVRTLRYVQGQLSSHAGDARAYFGANYPVVRDIVANDAPVEVKPMRRNRAMFRAMSRSVREEKIEKFAGFFGGLHTAYSVGNSLANKATGLPGIGSGDVLNIAEAAFTTRHSDSSVVGVKSKEELAALMGPCKAAVMPAGAVAGYKKRADFVAVVDLGE